jgi:hypothetical protein
MTSLITDDETGGIKDPYRFCQGPLKDKASAFSAIATSSSCTTIATITTGAVCRSGTSITTFSAIATVSTLSAGQVNNPCLTYP